MIFIFRDTTIAYLLSENFINVNYIAGSIYDTDLLYQLLCRFLIHFQKSFIICGVCLILGLLANRSQLLVSIICITLIIIF